jgi:dTDP-4-amino-4,6-dideoxygalactose transaminase
MKVPFLDLKTQYDILKSEIDPVIQNVLDNTAFIGGPALKAFEAKFAEFCHTQFCVGVGNGTDAIIVGLKAIVIEPGDEVITAANSFVATSEAITAAGGKVVFCDCLPEYYTIDPEDILRKITKNTRAIIPVHLYGQPANMPEIMKIAKEYNLHVIEDCAQAHGAEINGKRVGTWGDLGTFSFYPGKNLGAYGDGGAIVTNNSILAKKSRMIANHGRIDKYNHEFEGLNSRLDSIQCEVLSVKLNHLDSWNVARRKIAQKYGRLLKNISDLQLPIELEGTVPVYHLYVVRTSQRYELVKYLAEQGISTGVHYPISLHNLAAYEYLKHKSKDFPNANYYQDEILSLPIYPELSDPTVTYIAEAIRAFFKK